MANIRVSASGVVEATPQEVYAVLSDYHVGHPAILPKPYFGKLVVEEGGKGAGTVILVELMALGSKRTYRLKVTEPEPGRVLAESDDEAGVYTTFVVDPMEGGKHSRVTITTETRPSPGIMGLLERILNPPAGRFVFRKEIKQIDSYLRSQKSAPASA